MQNSNDNLNNSNIHHQKLFKRESLNKYFVLKRNRLNEQDRDA